VNLEWLDLSFNLITKIEGLEKLDKLTDLSLYSNQITVLEGLENLKQLNVLSVGKNKLTSHETAVTYLRGLKNKLEVLKMAENPFHKVSTSANENDYKYYVIAYLKDL
jgi:Leucine-rich repeat (LRR) protein